MISSPWAGEESRLHPPIKHLNQRSYNFHLHSIFTTLKSWDLKTDGLEIPEPLRNTESNPSDGPRILIGYYHSFHVVVVWMDGISLLNVFSRWWFQRFFVFTPIWGRFPVWLIFFKGVETTNQFQISLQIIPFQTWRKMFDEPKCFPPLKVGCSKSGENQSFHQKESRSLFV